MSLFLPDIYKKNVFSIDYKLLKNKGIKCLIFDLDNTIGIIDEEKCSDDIVQLISVLKKDFNIVISSNNTKKRLKPFIEQLKVEGISWSFKPLPKVFFITLKKYNVKREEICIIGDQLFTDVLAGRLYKVLTILVDSLNKKDLKITKISRLLESIVINSYTKKGIFERGKYYG